MQFYNNKKEPINFSIGGVNYSVKPGSEFNLKDSVALVVKNRLISYGLELTKNSVQTPESETPVGESSSESAPSTEEISEETKVEETSAEEVPAEETKVENTSEEAPTEEAPKRRGRRKKEEA